MTCIVAITSPDGTITMGADSGAFGDDWSVTVRADPKVFRKGDMLFGFASSFRMGQLLRFRLEVPTPPEGMDPFEYMATDFVDAVRTCFEDGGYLRKDNERESGGTFLVGWRGRVYRIESDYQVSMSESSIEALGAGEAYALGSLYSISMLHFDHVHDLIRHALGAARYYCAAVREPWVIETLEPERP